MPTKPKKSKWRWEWKWKWHFNAYASILSILLLTLIVFIFWIILSPDVDWEGSAVNNENDNNPSTYSSMLPTEENSLTKGDNDPVQNEKTYLASKDINILELSKKLKNANNKARDCVELCEHTQNTENCVKANKILSDAHFKIRSFKNYEAHDGLTNLTDNEKTAAAEVNFYLIEIPLNVENALSKCKKTLNSLPTPTIKKRIEPGGFIDQKINLDIIYSKINKANTEIRYCKLNCEAISKNYDNCRLFIKLRDEYQTDLNNLSELLKKRAMVDIYSNNLSPDDRNNILRIFELLKDIDNESKNVDECLDSLQ